MWIPLDIILTINITIYQVFYRYEQSLDDQEDQDLEEENCCNDKCDDLLGCEDCCDEVGSPMMPSFINSPTSKQSNHWLLFDSNQKE